MSRIDKLVQENRALRERLSRLAEATLRINESHDLDTVLCDVVESAGALTGARGSGIVTMDADGQLEGFVTTGLAAGENRRLLKMPRGSELREYLRQILRPLRLAELGPHLRAQGFPDDATLARSFLGMPIRHQGVHLGNSYQSNKQGVREFTGADEEVLSLFAAQAGVVHAFVRRLRRKLGDDATSPRYIFGEPRVGCRTPRPDGG